MKSIWRILVLSVCVSVASSGCGDWAVRYGKPHIPKSNIPADTPEDVRKQIEQLYSTDGVARAYAAFNLGQERERAASAVPFLIDILYDDSALRWIPGGPETSPGREAAIALSKIGKAATESLIASMKEKKYGKAHHNIAEILGTISDPRKGELLITALQQENSLLRANAALALGYSGIKDRRTVELLIAALEDENSEVRAKAAWALGLLKAHEALGDLISALKDKDGFVRQWAAVSLGELGDPQAVDPLILALGDRTWFVRAAVARALGKIGDPRAIGSLNKARRWWSSGNVPVQRAIGEALQMLERKNAVPESKI